MENFHENFSPVVELNLPIAIASGFIDETLRAEAEGAGVQELIFKANAVEEFCDAFVRLTQMFNNTTISS